MHQDKRMEKNSKINYKFAFLNDRLFKKDGFEIWRRGAWYLVLDRTSRYGNFYKTLDEAKKDTHISAYFSKEQKNGQCNF